MSIVPPANMFLLLQDLMVLRTVTHSAVGGLISSRDFVDLILNVQTDEFYATNGMSIAYICNNKVSSFIQMAKKYLFQ